MTSGRYLKKENSKSVVFFPLTELLKMNNIFMFCMKTCCCRPQADRPSILGSPARGQQGTALLIDTECVTMTHFFLERDSLLPLCSIYQIGCDVDRVIKRERRQDRLAQFNSICLAFFFLRDRKKSPLSLPSEVPDLEGFTGSIFVRQQRRDEGVKENQTVQLGRRFRPAAAAALTTHTLSHCHLLQ